MPVPPDLPPAIVLAAQKATDLERFMLAVTPMLRKPPVGGLRMVRGTVSCVLFRGYVTDCVCIPDGQSCADMICLVQRQRVVSGTLFAKLQTVRGTIHMVSVPSLVMAVPSAQFSTTRPMQSVFRAC